MDGRWCLHCKVRGVDCDTVNVACGTHVCGCMSAHSPHLRIHPRLVARITPQAFSSYCPRASSPLPSPALAHFCKRAVLAVDVALAGGIDTIAALCCRVDGLVPDDAVSCAVAALGDMCVHLTTNAVAAARFKAGDACTADPRHFAAAVDIALRTVVSALFTHTLEGPVGFAAIAALAHVPSAVLVGVVEVRELLTRVVAALRVAGAPTAPPVPSAAMRKQDHRASWNDNTAVRVTASASLLRRFGVTELDGDAAASCAEACVDALWWWRTGVLRSEGVTLASVLQCELPVDVGMLLLKVCRCVGLCMRVCVCALAVSLLCSRTIAVALSLAHAYFTIS